MVDNSSHQFFKVTENLCSQKPMIFWDKITTYRVSLKESG